MGVHKTHFPSEVLPPFLQGDGIVRRGLHRVLQVSLPVPPRSDAEIAAEVERNYCWNYAVNMLDITSFWFGASFTSASTILPLFISKLTPSPLAVGLLAVIAQGGWFFPQLFTANIVEQLPRKKPVVVNLGFFLERVPYWVAILTAVIAGRFPKLAVVAFLLTYAWHTLGAGFVATAWQDLIARCFPVNRRGRFFGMAHFLGAAVGILGGMLSSRILAANPFPTNFVYAFTIAALFVTFSWLFLSLAREPIQPVTKAPKSNREFWSELPEIVRYDQNFRRFLIVRTLMALGGMGSGFITVAAVKQWHIPDSMVGVYTGSMLIGQTVSHLIFGFLVDRLGHKLALILGALASVLAFAVAWLAPAPEWYCVVFALQGVNSGAIVVSGLLVVMEFCAPERRPTYIGLTNSWVGIVSMIAPLIGTLLAGWSYAWLFAVSAVFNVFAMFLMQWGVQEPRKINGQLDISVNVGVAEA